MRLIRDLASARGFLTRRVLWESEGANSQIAKGIARIFGQELSLTEAVARILKEVRSRGDEAIKELTRRIDGVDLESLEVSQAELEEAEARVPAEVLASLQLAARRVRAYQKEARKHALRDFRRNGLGQRVTPLDKVGVYVPGGAGLYPSTVLMTVIPARVAGVGEVVLATPPRKDGTLAPVVLAAANLSGVDRMFRVGGAQAIGALAFGTETVPKVDKIVGPGNLFVQTAKRLVFGVVGIDTIQGPSEAIAIADDSIDPEWCAADLLAQAEHDPEASSILITTSPRLGSKVAELVEGALKRASREKVLRLSLEQNGAIILVDTVEEAIELSNLYAPEHLCLMVEEAERYVPLVRHAGALFLGPGSPHVLGDYLAGPSHALPTAGAARYSSALGVGDFLKVTSLIALSPEKSRALLRPGVAIAGAEGFQAHARSLDIRMARR